MILAATGVFNDSSSLLLDSSGNAATATILKNARTIGGVSFNGSANIDLPGVNTTGNQNTTGNAATATTAGSCTGNAATATSALTCTGNAATATSALTCTGNAASATTTGTCTGNAATATTAGTCTGNAATATTALTCTGNAASATTIRCGDTEIIHIGNTTNSYGLRLFAPSAGNYNSRRFDDRSGILSAMSIDEETPTFSGGRIGFGTDQDSVDECGIGKATNKDLYIWNTSDTEDDILLLCNGSVTTNNNVATASDARLKHNIKSVSNALSDIRLLRLCSYYKSSNMYEIGHNFELDVSGIPITNNNLKYEIGFIAQEVQNIDTLKHAVKDKNKKSNVITGDPHPITIEYNTLFCYSIAALQELDSAHTQTCEELKAAEQRIVSLETRLSALEARLQQKL